MNLKSPAVKVSKALVCAMIAAILGACGGDESPDPLQKYREQTVQWTECDPHILGAENPLDQLVKNPRLRCSFVRAPLDWANAERGDIVMAVMRLAAGQSEKRRGALVFNPGGPGADGLGSSLSLITAFGQSNPDNPQGARQLRLLNEYDMVGFSPRGTGASTQLQCATNELEHFVDVSVPGWDSAENMANAYYNGRKEAEACLKNPITPYINTDATARDMELLRGLLGDEKLNYVGYSYGTWLGAWYASLFPEKVGRMVLDSSMNFAATLEEELFATPVGLQHLLDEWLTPYAARHADYFQLGASEADVRTNLRELSPRTRAILGAFLGNLSYARESADDYLDTISAARGLDAVLKTAPDPSNGDAITEALGQHVFYPSNMARDTTIRTMAVDLQQKYFEKWVQPKLTSVHLEPSEAVQAAVYCNDTLSTTDLPARMALLQGVAQSTPLFFSNVLTNQECAFWGGPRVSKPDPSNMKSLQVLFVQSQYDAATPTAGANVFFAHLPAAQRVYVSDDFQHAVYPYVDSCVDPLVTSYLLGDSLAQREVICPAHPLAQDASSADTFQKSLSQSASGTSVYKDSKKARELIDEFKRGVIRSHQRS